jgi:tetratricopeptide (TPR) repeat protein
MPSSVGSGAGSPPAADCQSALQIQSHDFITARRQAEAYDKIDGGVAVMKLWLAFALTSTGLAMAQGNDCATLEQCLKAIDAHPQSSLAHFRLGEILFMQEEWNRAAHEFREAQHGDREPQWVEVWAHIYAGRTYDLTNQRARAINEYTLVLQMNDVLRDAKEEAAEYIKSPYRRP